MSAAMTGFAALSNSKTDQANIRSTMLTCCDSEELYTTMSPGSGKASIRVAAFTGAKDSAPRFRVRQYIPLLRQHGVLVAEFLARFGSWPPPNKMVRPFWLAATVVDRLPSVAWSHQYDLTLLHREMVSTLVTLERFTRRPRVLDVDDAVWVHQRAARNFPALARMCDGVVCGNNFLAENVQQWNKSILVLPTAVDTEQFCPLDRSSRESSKRIIGWSGVFSNLSYLYGIERALAVVLDKHKDVVLRVVSGMKPKFQWIDDARVEYIPWSPENDAPTIQEMSIGLMPIEDSVWGRGKCSYKMLLYMSCGLPAVVSPVGMNNEVLALGKVGFAARTEAEWADCLSWLLDHPEEAGEMGRSGRRVVEQHYGLQLLAPRLAGYLKTFAR